MNRPGDAMQLGEKILSKLFDGVLPDRGARLTVPRADRIGPGCRSESRRFADRPTVQHLLQDLIARMESVAVPIGSGM